MSSHNQSYFQPRPPKRASTADSQKSHSSGAASPTDLLSPASTFSHGCRSAASPTEESFFGAITSRMRHGRSRSRSRADKSRKRSKSPMVMPPEQFPATSSMPQSSSYSTHQPQQSRHISRASQSSVTSVTTKPTRPSLQGPTRRSTGSSDMWRGRHSNSWLFNDFSVTDTAKGVFHIGRKS